jgi:hypothetical protein
MALFHPLAFILGLCLDEMNIAQFYSKIIECCVGIKVLESTKLCGENNLC